MRKLKFLEFTEQQWQQSRYLNQHPGKNHFLNTCVQMPKRSGIYMLIMK